MGKSKKSSKSERIINTVNIIKNIIFTIILVILVIIIVSTVLARVTGGTPSVFGFSLYRISSGSMTPELEVGDVVLNRECDPMTIKKGDIVTYLGRGRDIEGVLITHRAISDPYKDGTDFYINTQGDANDLMDDPVQLSQVKGVFVAKLDWFSMLYSFFITPWGLLTIIALIVLAFFKDIVTFIRIVFLGESYEKNESIEQIIERYQKENKSKEEVQTPNIPKRKLKLKGSLKSTYTLHR